MASRAVQAPHGLAAAVRLREAGIDARAPWQDRARCRDVDVDAFFPERGESSREAKEICAACPVRIECLNYALHNDERHGVWGGMTERERRRLRSVLSRQVA